MATVPFQSNRGKSYYMILYFIFQVVPIPSSNYLPDAGSISFVDFLEKYLDMVPFDLFWLKRSHLLYDKPNGFTAKIIASMVAKLWTFPRLMSYVWTCTNHACLNNVCRCNVMTYLNVDLSNGCLCNVLVMANRGFFIDTHDQNG